MRPKERNNLEIALNNSSRMKAIAKQAYKWMTYDERKKLNLIKK